MEYAVFGGGCFWCIEAIFSQMDGVTQVLSGYAGGHTKNPSYKEVCSGVTGHAEVCRIKYDSEIISFETLLKAFWESHDPTTINRQGNDIGTQYRSIIFYVNESQKLQSSKYKKMLDDSKLFNKPIITEITELTKFYEAENYHQSYYLNNSEQPYCRVVIRPKLDKFFKEKTHSK